MRQRYYNPNIGRFARRDTFEGELDQPLSLHKYAYVDANPANLVDPNGLTPLDDGDWVHNLIGFHYLAQRNIYNYTNPMNSNGQFVYSRVYEPRPPISWIANRPTYRRIIRTATGNAAHAGAASINRQSPDLADFNYEELYEIKPNRQHWIQEARNKLDLAEHTLGSPSINLSGWHRGDTYVPPVIVPIPGSRNFAVVRNYEPGVIVYDLLNTQLTLKAIQMSVAIMEQALKQLIASVAAAAARSSRGSAYA